MLTEPTITWAPLGFSGVHMAWYNNCVEKNKLVVYRKLYLLYSLSFCCSVYSLIHRLEIFTKFNFGSYIIIKLFHTICASENPEANQAFVGTVNMSDPEPGIKPANCYECELDPLSHGYENESRIFPSYDVASNNSYYKNDWTCTCIYRSFVIAALSCSSCVGSSGVNLHHFLV